MQRIVKNAAIAAAAVVMSGAATANAAVLGSWNFNDVNTTYAATNGPWTNSAIATEATTSLNESSLDHLGADETRDASVGSLGSPGLLLGLSSTGATPVDPVTPAAPVSTTDYMTITLTSNENFVDLSSVSFKVGQSVAANQNASGTINFNRTYMQAFYNINGGAFTAVGAQQVAELDISDGLAKWSGYETKSIDLSAIPDLASGDVLELRLGITDNRGGGSTSMASYWDDFEITGGVIPEPGSLALVGLAGLGLLSRRRKA